MIHHLFYPSNKMNQIIADKTLETTKKFIQDRIHSSYLTESVRNKFTSLYANLTVDNAKEVYSEVFRLNGQLIHAQTRELHYSMLKVSGIFLLVPSYFMHLPIY